MPTSAQIGGWNLVASLFGVDSDGNVYVKGGKGFYGTSFVSSRGSDPEAGQGGGTGVDMDAVWDALAAGTTEKINVSHLSATDLASLLTSAGYKLTDTIYTLPKATVSALGGIKAAGVRTSAITTTQGGTTSGRYYGVELDSTGKAFVNVPWANTTYTLTSFGITATAAEINKLDGLATTKTELGYVHGVTGSIQTQLNGKLNNGSTTYGTAYARGFQINGNTYTLWAITNPGTIGPFFAPSSAGTSGYILQSTGGVPAWIARSALTQQLFSGGKGCVAIPENSDLNDYTTPGLYYCPANATVQTLANVPVTGAFSLEILQAAGVIQILREYGYSSNANEYTRRYYNGSWTTWVRAPRLNELYTKTEADGRYLKLTGGTMTGDINARNIEIPTGSYIYSVMGENGGAMVGFVNGHTQLGSVGASSTSATHIRSITGHATIGAGEKPAYNILDSGNYTTYTVTKTGGGASGTWPIGISGNAASATTATNATYAQRANYLFGEYTGSGGNQPPSYFNGKGLKVNMMNKPVAYSDVIVVNGYNGIGADVPYINAIAFQKTDADHGDVYHARGDYGGDSWGTWHKFLDSYNYTSYTLNRDAIVSTIGVSGTDLVGWTYNGVARSRVTQAQLRTMLGLGSNAYTSTAYLPQSSYTAADVLAKLKTVDGSGSGLDADLLDGTQKSGLLTSVASTAATNLSVTVGGTVKSVADLYATYLSGETLQYVGAGRGIPFRFKFGTAGDTTTYMKIGTLPLPSAVGSGESKVVFFVYGGINFGGRDESVHIGTASTRGSAQVSLRNIKGSLQLKLGYVTTSSNVEIWLCHTTTYLGTTTIEVVASSNFTYSMTRQNDSPSGAVWTTTSQLATVTDNVASATKLATARTLWGQSFNGTANVDGSITVTSGYVYLKGGWFQNNVSGQGLYNAAHDARWRADASGWRADKAINADAGLNTTTITASSHVTVGTSGSLNLAKAGKVGLLIDNSLRDLSWTVDTSGGWARALRATDPTGNTVLMNVAGIYGGGQTPNYVYMGGTSYTNAPFVVTYGGVVGIGTTSPSSSYKLSVVGAGNFTGRIFARNGVTIGSTDDIGWYLNSSRITAGTQVARGVNVGNLLVSNVWADYTKVPANGIYAKGAVLTDGYLQVGSGRLRWDAANNALYVEKSDGTACGLYSKGYMSARGSDPEASAGGSSELVPVVDISKLTVGTNVSITVLASAGLTNDVLEKMRDGAVGRVKAVFSDGNTEIWPVLHASNDFISFGYDTVAGGYQDTMNIYEITIPSKTSVIRVEHFER